MSSLDGLQIVFSESAAGSLKFAANSTGRKIDHVLVPLIECAHVGPINLLDKPEQRLVWIRDNAPDLYTILACGDDGVDRSAELVGRWQSYIDKLKHWDGAASVWYSKYDIQDMSMILMLCQIMPGFQSAQFVDIGNISFEGQHPISVGICSASHLLSAEKFLRVLAPTEADQFRSSFKRFRDNPAGLRLFHNKEVIETPLSRQDELLLRHITENWRKASAVFAETLNEGMREGVRDRDYLFLLSRIHFLTQNGALERRHESSLRSLEQRPLMGDIRRRQKSERPF